MISMAKRIEILREEKGLSRPELAAALGFPRLSLEKFETGRQTPTGDQQKRLAEFFGVSLLYLKGETDDRTTMSGWLDGDLPKEEPITTPKMPATRKVVAQAGETRDDTTVFSALLKSDAFRGVVKEAVLEVLRSEEGQQLIAKVVRRKSL